MRGRGRGGSSRDAGGEVEVVAVGRPGRAAGDQVPVRREVADPVPGRRVEDEQVRRRPAVACFADDDIEALVAADHDFAAIGGPLRAGVVVFVVGEPGDRPVDGGDPEVGALVAVLVALVGVGRERDAGAVGAPRQPGSIEAEVGELPGLAASGRQEEDLARRGRPWVAGVGEVAAAVEAVVHPVVRATVETFGGAALEVGVVDGLGPGPLGRNRARERDPAAVRAEVGGAVEAVDLEGLSRRAVHAQEPGAAAGLAGRRRTPRREVEVAAIRGPGRARSAEAWAGDARRLTRPVRVGKPDLAVAAVLILQNRRDHECHLRAVRRECRTADALQPVVVLDLERAA